MKDQGHVLMTLPDSAIADATTDEQIRRVFNRKARNWEIEFFRDYMLTGQIDAEGMRQLLMQDPESFGRNHIAWPMPLSGWN